ncbi:MAG: (d)CMP kinase [Peptococcaceae bacterium]|nr:(d)CMP kinase [Peptococcaceae bacterium]
MNRLNIAIDGPAGAGKSTVAKQIAVKLGLIYIDTGAMYRALTWKALQNKVSITDAAALTKLAAATEVVLSRALTGQLVVRCDGVDVSDAIRTPEVSSHVAELASCPGVRRRLVEMQQHMAAQGGVIMDGRDIGSTVLPNAAYKFFLTASLAERARRRWLELQASGYQIEYQDLEAEIATRDRQDSNRAVAPLQMAPDAICINSDGLNLEQVIDKILSYISAEF